VCIHCRPFGAALAGVISASLLLRSTDPDHEELMSRLAERVRFEAATTTHNKISSLQIPKSICVPLRCTRKCPASTLKIPRVCMKHSVIEVADLTVVRRL
jgi:hypothetical protein